VFSQFGDDGILQYLIRQTVERFIEFGVQDYSSQHPVSALNDNWFRLIMDADPANGQRQEDPLLATRPASFRCVRPRENVSTLFEQGALCGGMACWLSTSMQ
jgi:hypothetical protein